jgi:cell division control protein 24
MSTPRKKSTATPGATAATTPAPNQLNKQASSTTGIYQQSVLLRSRLARIPDFAPFLAFSQSGPRASLDVVSQLWQTFAFGIPLCVLFNLVGGAKIVDIGAPDIDHLQDLSMNDRKRAVAKFIMAIGTLRDDGRSDNAFLTLSITEVVNLQDTNGFVKLVTCLLYLLDRLPECVWSSEPGQSFAEPSRLHDNLPSKETCTPQEVERANIIRELIETERKYVQDLEAMLVCTPQCFMQSLFISSLLQSYAQQLRSHDIVSSDTIHKLFPALSNLADSQRKFLITIEATFELPWEEQDWGKCFSDHVRRSRLLVMCKTD